MRLESLGLLEIRRWARVLQGASESMFLKEAKAWWELFSFPIELTRRVWISPRPELRADPPSASVHLPAAVRGGFDFVRHKATAQGSGAGYVRKNVNFYQLEGIVSTRRFVSLSRTNR